MTNKQTFLSSHACWSSRRYANRINQYRMVL